MSCIAFYYDTETVEMSLIFPINAGLQKVEIYINSEAILNYFGQIKKQDFWLIPNFKKK